MSRLFRVDVRERWSARSMIVKRWLFREIFDPEQPVCELEVDDLVKPLYCRDPVLYTNRPYLQPDFGMVRRFYVAAGQEIGPFGRIFEFEGTTRIPEPPDVKIGPPLHSSSKIELRRRERYPRIFVNYRRDDADAYAWRLHEALSQEFAEDEVFLAEFSIRPGEVWPWTVQQAAVHARVVIALIGRRWLLPDEAGRRRIDLPDDMVRREIVAAVDSGTLLPVILPESSLPDGKAHERVAATTR